MKELTFSAFRQANVDRQKEWPGYEMTDTTFKALEVCGEAGELAEAIKKLVRSERGIGGSTASLEEVADELGDVIISADLLADHLGIDLAQAVSRKYNKTSVKYGLESRLPVVNHGGVLACREADARRLARNTDTIHDYMESLN